MADKFSKETRSKIMRAINQRLKRRTRFAKNYGKEAFDSEETFPLLAYLVIVRHQIINNDYATYLKLKQKIEETMYIEIINLEEIKKQAGAI